MQFVPGQLQTADYARAVIRLGYPEAAAEEIERRTALRISRQHGHGAAVPAGRATDTAVLLKEIRESA